MSVPAPRIKTRTLLAIIVRSFFLQSCWNFQGMQNLGFGFSLIPLVKALQPGREAREAMLKRHLEFFNTHPYCASIILGVVTRLEAEAAENPGQQTLQANQVKSGMMGPLAALGDMVFWAMLRPALALAGVSFVLAAPAGQVWPALLGPIIFLGLFSVAHLGLRVGGVLIGFHRGIDIVTDLRRFNPQLLSRRIGIFTAVMLGALGAIYTFQSGATEFIGRWPGTGILLALSGLLFLGVRKGFSATQLFYGLIGLAVAIAYFGWI